MPSLPSGAKVAVGCVRRGQKLPQVHDNVQSMLVAMTRRGGGAGVCGTCMDARAMADSDLIEGAHESSLEAARLDPIVALRYE